MQIKSLKLMNFRTFKSKNLDFGDNNLIIINGPNAVGKTTILEAIYCLSLIKSYRTNNQFELVSNGFEGFYIDCLYKNKKEINKLSISRVQNSVILNVNNQQIKRYSDYIGNLNVVLFSSTDFLLLKSGPKERRKIFDLSFCQMSKDYLKDLSLYSKLIKDRNVLLKRINFNRSENSMKLLESIDERLIAIGSRIISQRIDLIKIVENYSNGVHLKVTNSKEEISLKYVPSIGIENYKSALCKNIEDDIKTGHTSVGPHRDDFIFMLNGRDVSSFGSQGQQRNVLLSCKLGMAEMINSSKKESPIILLDDVFSELDHERQNSIIKNLNGEYQTIITAASIAELDQLVINQATIIKID